MAVNGARGRRPGVGRDDDRHVLDQRSSNRRELGRVALDLALTVGLDAVTVDEIAFGAGLSRRTFFRCFGSKDEAILFRFDAMFERVEREARSALRSGPTWSSLRAACVQAAAGAMQDPSGMRELRRLVDGAPGLRSRYVQRVDSLRRTLLELAASPGEPANNVELMVYCAVGIMEAANAWWAGSDEARPDELVRMIMADFDRVAVVFTSRRRFAEVPRPT